MWPDASGDWSIGPQIDGTNNTPVQMPQPVDAGGGSAASYGSSVLDIFKFGVGVVQQQQNRQDMLDYRRWEATQGALTSQGSTAGAATTGGVAIGSGTLLLLAVAVVGVVLIARA